MTLEEIKQLIDLTNESGIAELEVERGGNRVRIRRTAGVAAPEIVMHPAQAAPVAAAPTPIGGTQKAVTADPSLLFVKSPIVGTFYESPSPESDAFVKVGDIVQPGQVLCIIESMKLMNEIEAEVAGTIVAKLVETGKPVEYGEALFSIRPS
jgi:acetyl-CoA carboxylase biotin carboxyl carrier protein